MARTLLILLFLSVFSLQAQEEQKVLFSDALAANMDKYTARVDEALKYGEFDFAKSLFDTLVKSKLQGTYLDNLEFENLNNSFITSTEDFERPTIILTYSSWCIPSDGEIPVLNKLAERYAGLVDFIVLFWDDKSTVKKEAKKFHKNIQVAYVDEVQNKHMKTVNLLKHALGISLSYVIAADGQILDINRRPPNQLGISGAEIINQNLNFLNRQIAAINLDLNININDLPESLATF
ncbi:TlpA family protein disulfide reductase [Leeuwenhoekiella parthenopeia]|uniref:Thioredoxin family protein n=1 Tax=Leeuwenhoekiella parthenopeia TaxID=2890320 RepID=A0ABS8GTV9_9FLAO|nr:thioredoxin family protein [Leeuwenhoekiella parthenopeia]MCC4213213.1 thioredoxin family protein [Leeuwenhoekiella parthenopeia]